MNSLSWLIYFGTFSSSAGAFMAFLAFVGAVLAIIGFVFTVIWTDSTRKEQQEKYTAFNQRGSGLISRGLAMLIVCGTVSVILPDRNTVYAIAASQVGEQIVKTEIASDATKALHSWIKKQIEPEPAKK